MLVWALELGLGGSWEGGLEGGVPVTCTSEGLGVRSQAVLNEMEATRRSEAE